MLQNIDYQTFKSRYGLGQSNKDTHETPRRNKQVSLINLIPCYVLCCVVAPEEGVGDGGVILDSSLY